MHSYHGKPNTGATELTSLKASVEGSRMYVELSSADLVEMDLEMMQQEDTSQYYIKVAILLEYLP